MPPVVEVVVARFRGYRRGLVRRASSGSAGRSCRRPSRRSGRRPSAGSDLGTTWSNGMPDSAGVTRRAALRSVCRRRGPGPPARAFTRSPSVKTHRVLQSALRLLLQRVARGRRGLHRHAGAVRGGWRASTACSTPSTSSTSPSPAASPSASHHLFPVLESPARASRPRPAHLQRHPGHPRDRRGVSRATASCPCYSPSTVPTPRSTTPRWEARTSTPPCGASRSSAPIGFRSKDAS